VTPRAEDSEASHLIELVRIQAVTRKEARTVVLGEDPLVDETVQGLLNKIYKLQATDPLYIRIKKEITIKISIKSKEGIFINTSRDGYFLD
jgi:hypothetical protein